MANYMPGPGNDDETGFILLTGGCDSPKGNERLVSDDPNEQDLFICTSTSNQTLRFDPVANTFTTVATMPHARQRHAATVVGRYLVVLGGRDTNDDLVTAIDVRVSYRHCVCVCVCVFLYCQCVAGFVCWIVVSLPIPYRVLLSIFW